MFGWGLADAPAQGLEKQTYPMLSKITKQFFFSPSSPPSPFQGADRLREQSERDPPGPGEEVRQLYGVPLHHLLGEEIVQGLRDVAHPGGGGPGQPAHLNKIKSTPC